jgi:hypothetical protein
MLMSNSNQRIDEDANVQACIVMKIQRVANEIGTANLGDMVVYC